MTHSPDELDRRWSARIGLDELSGCWLWTGSLNHKGYAQLGRRLAHRAIYELLVGALPAYGTADVQLDHLCRVRRCVNPDHLEPVTSRENTLRGETVAAANAQKVTCVNGHLLTPGNFYERKSGGRRACKACGRQRAAAYAARKRQTA